MGTIYQELIVSRLDRAGWKGQRLTSERSAVEGQAWVKWGRKSDFGGRKHSVARLIWMLPATVARSFFQSYLGVMTSLEAGEAARCSARRSCSTCWLHSAISSSRALISRAS